MVKFSSLSKLVPGAHLTWAHSEEEVNRYSKTDSVRNKTEYIKKIKNEWMKSSHTLIVVTRCSVLLEISWWFHLAWTGCVCSSVGLRCSRSSGVPTPELWRLRECWGTERVRRASLDAIGSGTMNKNLHHYNSVLSNRSTAIKIMIQTLTSVIVSPDWNDPCWMAERLQLKVLQCEKSLNQLSHWFTVQLFCSSVVDAHQVHPDTEREKSGDG